MKNRLKKYYNLLFKQHKRKTWFALLFLLIIYWQILPNPLFNDPTSYVLEDKNGNLLGARITTDGQWRFPETDHVPDKFAKAIVAFEDKRFWYHFGIDPIGIVRSAIAVISTGRKACQTSCCNVFPVVDTGKSLEGSGIDILMPGTGLDENMVS